MSGRLFGDHNNCTMLLKHLMDSVKEVQNAYGKNKTLLATERDDRCANPEINQLLLFTINCLLIHFLIEFSECVRIGNQHCPMD